MKKLLLSPLSLLLISAAIAGWTVYRQVNQTTPEQQYRMQAVEQGDISQTVSANGTINPVTLVNVGTQVSGTVKKLYVDFNNAVEKGQVLLELDNALLSAQLKQDMANVEIARASVELAGANEARTRSLFNQEYASRLELDTAIQAKKAALSQMSLTQATVEKDRANLAYSVIRSPVSGVVVDRSVDVGQTVAASLQTPTLFKIAQDLSKMQINSSFAEADIGKIRVGQTVRFTVDAYPNRNFQGTVRLIRLNPTTVQNVVTYDVVINVANPEQILMPGMTAYVSIAVTERRNVLFVPNIALRFKPADKTGENTKPRSESGKPKEDKRDGFSGRLYVLRNGQLVAVPVKLGITDNRNTEILSGDIKASDQIVTGDAQGSTTQTGTQPMRMRMF
ncbi:MAG TPA: efflux RND transporter periplasmic adaptor subunit [Gallionella sp.]|nr:MAG: efflux transporter periplasmic adaptor subunit [Gallionellales bacterium GWA2_54_124]OGT19575.1 MAG: efflux transporter periplasmic adaptor subunit [Gallionellales bacterium RIFOXYD12_FULL_53_10]HCI52264.1 efflux RND transporter periplasmic adaptor subunit [Gallionella sp.]